MSDVRMRQLSLHASALNDAEYELYTSILQGLVWADDQENSSASPSGHDDAYYEQMRVGAREVRAWIRGRYAHIAPATIDGVSSHPTFLNVLSTNLLPDFAVFFAEYGTV